MTAIPEENPMKRPTSLTVLGWLLIILDAGNFIYLPLSLRNPASIALLSQYRVPIGVTILVGLLVSALCFAAGIAILKGREWGRTLYLGASVAGFVISIATMPMDSGIALVPGILIFVVFCYLLYRRPANAYFREQKRV
ncbi:hypothetical protein PQR66_32330 [Paraburkholderia agricolaris]|jgi:uncharacterized membrane protein (UPF0136 family)|uniref:DoxX-like family protein n=1 Tax=Paraburkholderia agricolaris TaxID=2152888 RepID=A0ABW8ZYH8_9BURK